MYEYPFGNGQQLNLDWFLNEWKNLLAAWEAEKNGIEGALQAEIDRAEAALADVFAARDAAAQSAANALESKNAAAQSASDASGYLATVRADANTASNAAQNAAQSESNAAESAQTALASKNTAANSERNAAQSEANANSSKNAAAQSAADALAHKDAAAQSAADSLVNKNAAAQSAEDASDAAASVEASSQQIATNTSDISNLKESLNIQYITDENFVDDTNLLNNTSWGESGYMRATNGTLVTSQYTTAYIASDFIPVVPGFKYRAVCGTTGGGFTLYAVFFSDAKNDGTNTNLDWVAAGDYKEFTVPENKTFVSFNCVYNGQNKLNALYRRTQYEDEKNIKIPRLVVDSGEFAGKTICNFGDSIFGLARPPVDISTFIANLTGATVYNCAFGGCQMARYEPQTSGYAAFSMYKLADAISADNWTEQENAIAGGSLPTYFAETVQLLKSINWNKVDIITISYGTNDFENGLAPTAPEGASDTMFGVSDALQYSVNKILSAYPAIRIFVCLPCYRVWVNDGTFNYDSNTAIHTSWVGSGETYTFKDFINAEKEVAIANQIPYIDNYNIGVNQYNWSFYLPTTDGTHYNSNGRRLIAQKMVHELF